VRRLELLLIVEQGLQHLLARRVCRRQGLGLPPRLDPGVLSAEQPPLVIIRLALRSGGDGGGGKERCGEEEGGAHSWVILHCAPGGVVVDGWSVPLSSAQNFFRAEVGNSGPAASPRVQRLKSSSTTRSK